MMSMSVYQFVDQFANRMNDMMNLIRCKDRNGRRSEDEELGNPFFEGDCSSSNEWGDYGVVGDDYEGAPIFDDDYEEAPVFNDDQFEEESMPVYDTDIEYVIEEEEGFVGKGEFGEEEENMEDVVVVANDLCSLMIQTTLRHVVGDCFPRRHVVVKDYAGEAMTGIESPANFSGDNIGPTRFSVNKNVGSSIVFPGNMSSGIVFGINSN
ncbi:hypothetical protein Tco_0232226 [Tanacetum coccineum]